MRFNSRVSSPAPDPAASATRQAILAAAKSLLAEQGRDALNMSRVARRARINRGTTYLHYASREALLLDTLKDVSRELCAEVFPPDSALVDNDPDRWLDGAERLARFAMAKPALGQIWLNYILTSDAAASVSQPASPRYGCVVKMPGHLCADVTSCLRQTGNQAHRLPAGISRTSSSRNPSCSPLAA